MRVSQPRWPGHQQGVHCNASKCTSCNICLESATLLFRGCFFGKLAQVVLFVDKPPLEKYLKKRFKDHYRRATNRACPILLAIQNYHYETTYRPKIICLLNFQNMRAILHDSNDSPQGQLDPCR